MAELRPESRSKQMYMLRLAIVEMLKEEVALVDTFRRRGVKTMTLLDFVTLIYVYTFREEGVRQAAIVNYLHMPRSTVLGSIERLVNGGLVVEEGRLLYPSQIAGEIILEEFTGFMKSLGRLADAVEAARAAKVTKSVI